MRPFVLFIFALSFSFGYGRNVYQQPFTPLSIWNHPIGSGAVYVNAKLDRTPAKYAELPGSDPMRIVLSPTSPLTNIMYSDAGWTGKNRCSATSSRILASVPVPSNYVVPNTNKNECAVFLAADGVSLIQVQPLAICTAGGIGTSVVREPREETLYGNGTYGIHGGSGLSAIGGAIRLGELRPSQIGIPHALNLVINTAKYLYRATTDADTYRWPAYKSDSGAVGTYGSITGNTIKAMKMGVLLALLPSSTLPTTLRTGPGKQIAWTFQNYGGYVTDGTGDDFLMSTEEGYHGSLIAQFRSDWGFSFEQRDNEQTDWVKDIEDILVSLHAVDNNGPNSIGGGGTPRQPLAEPLTNPSATTKTPTKAPTTKVSTVAPTTKAPSPTNPTPCLNSCYLLSQYPYSNLVDSSKFVMTIRNCLGYCVNLGFKYSGISNGYYCGCSNSIAGATVQPTSKCNAVCPSTREVCGDTALSYVSVATKCTVGEAAEQPTESNSGANLITNSSPFVAYSALLTLFAFVLAILN